MEAPSSNNPNKHDQSIPKSDKIGATSVAALFADSDATEAEQAPSQPGSTVVQEIYSVSLSVLLTSHHHVLRCAQLPALALPSSEHNAD